MTFILQKVFLIIVGLGNFVLGCSKQMKSSLLVLDGVNVGETPSLLIEMEALNVPVALAVSMQDLRAFSTVRLIAREAALRGHHVVLSSDESGNASNEVKKEWSDHLGGIPLKYTTKSLDYNLDLSPDHITAIPQLVKDRITETPSIGRIIYLNSFVPNAKEKAIIVVKSYQSFGFQFISLVDCLKK